MNVKKLYRAAAAGLLTACALWFSAGAADPADPAVMGNVVRSPMKHIVMKDPVDTGTLIFPTARNIRSGRGFYTATR